MQAKEWTWYVAGCVAVALAGTSLIRDYRIESDREASQLLIMDYEKSVRKADAELSSLESQSIVLSDLAMIRTMQANVEGTARLLIGLAPVINSPGKVDKSSKASVDHFNQKVRAYNENIHVYRSQVINLNRVVGRANKQYEVKIVSPSRLDRSALSSDRKFLEIIGLAKTPILGPSAQVEAINQGIAARSDEQKSIRDEWNMQAKRINATNRTLNSLRDEVYRLYQTSSGSVRIDTAIDVSTGA